MFILFECNSYIFTFETCLNILGYDFGKTVNSDVSFRNVFSYRPIFAMWQYSQSDWPNDWLLSLCEVLLGMLYNHSAGPTPEFCKTRSHNSLFLIDFVIRMLIFRLHACYIPCLSRLCWFNYPTSVRIIAQITKLQIYLCIALKPVVTSSFLDRNIHEF